MKKAILIVTTAVCLSVLATAQAQQSSDLEARLLSLAPQSIVDDAKVLGDGQGNPAKINVVFKRADLNGTRTFDFVVALYSASVAVSLRVFHESHGEIQPVADLPQDIRLLGSMPELDLVDIQNNGKPFIGVRTFGASRRNYGLDVFQFLGNSLRSVTPGGIDNGDFFDVDGDGILEVVSSPQSSLSTSPDSAVDLEGGYAVFKFDGTRFTLTSESASDPTGRVSAAGSLQAVFAHRAVLDPGHFPLAAIQNAIQGNNAGGVVTLRLGNLTAGESPDLVDVTQIDPDSLRLNRTLRVLSAIVVVPSSDDAQTTTSTSTTAPASTAPLLTKFQGAVIQATFSRADFLKLLPRAQTDGPLAAGQAVSVDIDGKMKNGAPLFGVVKVQIVPA